MPGEVGAAIMQFGESLLGLAEAKKQREIQAAMTDLEVQVSRGSTALLSDMQKKKFLDLETPDGQNIGQETIQDFLQRHRDESSRISQSNPRLSQQYNQLIARAETHITNSYQGIKDEKFKEYDLSTLGDYLRTQSEAYNYANSTAERDAIIKSGMSAIQQRVGGSLKENEGFVQRNKWAAETHMDYVYRKLENLPANMALGSMEQMDKFIAEMTDARKYPYLTSGQINQIFEKSQNVIFQKMQRVNIVEGYASDKALLDIIRYKNANPEGFKTPAEVQRWADEQARTPGKEYMKSLNSRDLMTAVQWSEKDQPTDYSQLIAVTASNSSWQSKKRQIMDLWRGGKIGDKKAEMEISRIDSHIEAEKMRNAPSTANPLQDPLNHPYTSAISMLTHDGMTPAQKFSATAALSSFYNYRLQGDDPGNAFIKAVKDNKLNIGPSALPQMPAKYADPEPAESIIKLKADYNNGNISQTEFKRLSKQISNIRELKAFNEDLLTRQQQDIQRKKAGGSKLVAPTSSAQEAYKWQEAPIP